MLRAATLMSTPLQPGDTLRAGQYEIERQLGGGADKQVYLARDRDLGCLVALDVFAEDSVMPSGLSVGVWETRVLGKLGNHPNIGTVLNRWEDDGSEFMVSHYLPGGSLSDLIAGHLEHGATLPAGEILRIATEIARGLAHIHERRLLYRDLQPQNVLFDEWNTVRLVDFDTSCSLDESEMSDISGRPVVAYMAPEEIDGGPVDERADLYSLGATVYEMCCGRPPYAGDRAEILDARRSGGAPPLERDDLPEGLGELTFALLADETDQRPTSAADVVRSLQHVYAARVDLRMLLKSDESATLEFKSSLRVPVGDEPSDGLSKQERKDLELKIERSVTKTVAAFLNTDGGTLVIGSQEVGGVIGIEVDYPRLKKPSRDGWRLAFDDVICRDLGPEVMNWIDVQLEPLEDGTVAVVRCSPREEPTMLGKEEQFFVRRTASTLELTLGEALAWCRERSGKHRT